MEEISLTGPASHRLKLEPGVGSCTLGPGPSDLVVAVDDELDWNAFDRFTTPAGSPWPRWIGYEGDDTGWVAWSQHRPVEGFSWTPHATHDLDASRADIRDLSVTVRRQPLRVVLAPQTRFAAVGDLSLITPVLSPGTACPPLQFRPDTRTAHQVPGELPQMPALAGAVSVDVSVPPLRQPFDCASLAQFSGLRQLALSGSLTGLGALADLPGLTSLHLRYVPDLSELPPLDTWPDLTNLIVWNCDDGTGKRLRSEVRKSDREWRTARVTQPRKPAWFATEYGLPFSAWPSKSARAAVKAFRAAETSIAAASSTAAVEDAVQGFVRAINRLPQIETTEREDAAAAVALLTAETPHGDLRAPAESWFDAARDF